MLVADAVDFVQVVEDLELAPAVVHKFVAFAERADVGIFHAFDQLVLEEYLGCLEFEEVCLTFNKL